MKKYINKLINRKVKILFIPIFILFFISILIGSLGYAQMQTEKVQLDFPHQKVNLSAYIHAYPEFISKIKDNELIFNDKTTMPIVIHEWDNPQDIVNITLQKLLNNPDLYSQLLIPYPKGKPATPPIKNADPGRIRYVPFFQKMYGTTEEEVKKNLVEIPWLPKTLKGKESVNILVSKINGVDKIFKSLSEELDQLVEKNPDFKKYLENPGGTFSWRLIAGTNRPSAHSFGMTIDINVKYSNYWLWDYKKEHGLPIDTHIDESDIKSEDMPHYRNTIPWDIVEIFERHHFIWGGKMYHYDTMHFEYRPELF